MLDAAIEIGVAMLLATAHRTEVDRDAHLQRDGIEPWLSTRLSFFLPLAFGRALLCEEVFPDVYSAGGELHPLSDDEVWRAAVLRAEVASAEELELIGGLSAEVVARRQQRDGGREVDLTGAAPAWPHPLPARARDTGGAISPSRAFRRALRARGFDIRADHGAFATGAMRFGTHVAARVEESELAVEVSFIVEHPALALPHLEEKFSGRGGYGGLCGTWEDALLTALVRFEHGMLPVLIAGLLDRNSCAEEVTWEPLGDKEARFELCKGPVLREPGTSLEPSLDPFIDELKVALAEELAEKAHWVRVEVHGAAGKLYRCSVQLDHEAWEVGEQLAKRHVWSKHNGQWSKVWFMLVAPKRKAGGA